MKYGANGNLSWLPETPNGLPDPALVCNARAAKTNGKTKSNEWGL